MRRPPKPGHADERQRRHRLRGRRGTGTDGADVAAAPTTPASASSTAPRTRRPTSSAGSTSGSGATSFLTAMLMRKVPKGTNWFYTLGSATLFAFVVQALTGVFLAMYYTPSPVEAYASITHLTNDVFLGEFVRGMHKWGASVMVILVFVHMARTFFFGAYKYPRELNWVIGVVAADPDDGHGLHRLPAAVRPALLLGDDRRRQHQRHRPDRRPVPLRLPPRRPGVRRDHALALLRDPHAAGPRRDHRDDRRPPLPRGQARHDRAAVAAGRPQAEGRPRREPVEAIANGSATAE